MKLQDRVVLVFGGASGIGRACAQACVQEGAKVMVADVNTEGGEEVVAGITAGGGSAAFVHTDIADEQAVKRAVEATASELGGFYGLVTSAGGSGTPDSGSPWENSIQFFLKGPFYACKYSVEEMERRGKGAIVNIASLAGISGTFVTSLDQSGYNSAKHGVVGLTRSMALAYVQKNIRVNAICPGWIKTAGTKFLHEAPDGGDALINEKVRVPMGRWGEPEEIGKVAAFLLSDDASFITGQPIPVDGGFMAR